MGQNKYWKINDKSTDDVVMTSLILPNMLKKVFAWCDFDNVCSSQKRQKLCLKTCIKLEGPKRIEKLINKLMTVSLFWHSW